MSKQNGYDPATGAWNDSLVQHCEEESESIRAGIAAVLELGQVPGTQVVLTPSGTDGELYALYLAMGEDASPVHNILISSTETDPPPPPQQ